MTPYKEIDYVKSAYVFICNYLEIHFSGDLSANSNYCITNSNNFFDFINSNLPTGNHLISKSILNSIGFILQIYRYPRYSKPFRKLDLNKIDY